MGASLALRCWGSNEDGELGLRVNTGVVVNIGDNESPVSVVPRVV